MKLRNGFEHLNSEFNKSYFKSLNEFLLRQQAVIYPPKEKWLRVFELCNLDDIKVVILGQDPYHQPKQANGLCFSVNDGLSHPRSLRNILKEVSRDIGCSYPNSGDLTPWARQGVFLLNTILTVEESKPASHQNIGWETFTDEVIRLLNNQLNNIVFLLWGKYAQSKSNLIDCNKHLILRASHPSPFSAHISFNDCSHFSKANKYLQNHSKKSINWCL